MKFKSFLIPLLVVSLSCAPARAAKPDSGFELLVLDTPPIPELTPSKKVSVELNAVNPKNVDPIIKKLKELDDNPEIDEIWIKINSFGGEVYSGNKMIDTIQALKKPNVCVVDHVSMSMGFFILESCSKRLMTKRSILMAHEALVESKGNAHELRQSADLLEHLTDSYIEMCSKRMGMPFKEFKRRINNKEWYMSWEEALKFHAIDGVVDEKEIPPNVKVDSLEDLLKKFMEDDNSKDLSK
jgi:ATP-dependent Clp protease, protease subunit